MFCIFFFSLNPHPTTKLLPSVRYKLGHAFGSEVHNDLSASARRSSLLRSAPVRVEFPCRHIIRHVTVGVTDVEGEGGVAHEERSTGHTGDAVGVGVGVFY